MLVEPFDSEHLAANEAEAFQEYSDAHGEAMIYRAVLYVPQKLKGGRDE
jgi:hypothetical protein